MTDTAGITGRGRQGDEGVEGGDSHLAVAREALPYIPRQGPSHQQRLAEAAVRELPSSGHKPGNPANKLSLAIPEHTIFFAPIRCWLCCHPMR
jgi:hypothetical protein